MMLDLQIRSAAAADIEELSAVLGEAAVWLEQRGMPLWTQEQLQPAAISDDVRQGHYFIAWHDGSACGAFKYTRDDPLVWPDAQAGVAAYLHRVVVRRAQAGGTLASTMLQWAATRAQAEGRHYLRLDCEAARPKLRAVYERFGFVHHSDRRVGPYQVARYQLGLPAS